jgi:hypothetical protein
LLEQAFWNPAHFDKSFHDSLAQRIEIMRTAYVLKAVAKATLEEEFRQSFQKLLETKTIERGSYPLAVLREWH